MLLMTRASAHRVGWLMKDDPLFNARMPQWWDRVAFFIRGASLGFLLGYLFADPFPPSTVSPASMLVVACALLLAALPSLPKAWIEYRNRVRAWRGGVDAKHRTEGERDT